MNAISDKIAIGTPVRCTSYLFPHLDGVYGCVIGESGIQYMVALEFPAKYRDHKGKKQLVNIAYYCEDEVSPR